MSALHVILLLLAGLAAGTINAVVGSGTLITFPTLLAFGYSPITANVSNTVGLVPGSVSGAIGYRAELAGQRDRAIRLASASACGAILGAALLLLAPPSAFKAIVPAFIALALALIIFQKRINAALAKHRPNRHEGAPPAPRAALAGVFCSAIYGGYFGAAQGILLISVLSLTIDEPLQRLNAVKNVLGGVANLISGIVFILVAHVAWFPAALIAGGSIFGGLLGARYGRKLNPIALKALIVIVGIVAIVRLV